MSHTELIVNHLTDREAARYCGLSVNTIRIWRQGGRGLAYVKLGRAVRYSVADLEEFLRARRVVPGGEAE